MLKGTLLVMGFIAVWGGASFSRGCQQAQGSLTHLTYFERRDMRNTVGFVPQKVFLQGPDSLSVPTTGRERWDNSTPEAEVAERARLEKTFVNPEPMSDSSVARGERKFRHTCVPCHGPQLKGDGPVIAKFIPPPDLLGPGPRARTDGFIYGYLRHGGAVMPNYSAQVTKQEAYDLINFLRHEQRTNPR
jgi:mono/diheme cytochrome c family protein